MSRIKLLKDVVDDLQALVNSLGTLATAIESGEQQEPVSAEAEAPALTLSDVRAVLAGKSQAFTKEIKALINKYGAEKLSDVNPEHYEALLQEVEGFTK